MPQLEKALYDVITYNQEARKSPSDKGSCRKCSSAIDEVIKLSEPRIAQIYLEMKRKGTVRGTGVGCPECVDAFTFSQAYLKLLNSSEYRKLLELGKKYMPTENNPESRKRRHYTIE